MVNIISISIIITVFALCILDTIIVTNVANAEEQYTITIIPGSNDKASKTYFDVSFYPIQIGKQIRWFNADDIDHKLIITIENGTQQQEHQLADSGIIKSKGYFSYRFDKPGIYHFSSPVYRWMKGTVLVSNDITSETVTNLKNKVDVQLTWFPSKPKVGEETHFAINFINTNTHNNQEHVDYEFIITDNSDNKRVYQQALHSCCGAEQGSYKFEKAGDFTSEITIYDILFAPVEPDLARFNMTTKAS
jgi:plastocyanin